MPDRAPGIVYREIIDALVGKTDSVSQRLILDEGLYGRGVDDGPNNDFVRSLPLEQRQVLARLCRAERVSAIHDVLAELTWWIDCEDVALTVGGAEMAIDESGAGLHGDFIGRLDSWPWPDIPGGV